MVRWVSVSSVAAESLGNVILLTRIDHTACQELWPANKIQTITIDISSGVLGFHENWILQLSVTSHRVFAFILAGFNNIPLRNGSNFLLQLLYASAENQKSDHFKLHFSHHLTMQLMFKCPVTVAIFKKLRWIEMDGKNW